MKIKSVLVMSIALSLLAGVVSAGVVEIQAPCIANARQGNGWDSNWLAMQGEGYGALWSFFKYDLSDVPAGATINSATAYFYMDWGGNWFDPAWAYYSYQVLSDWNETGSPAFPAVSGDRIGAPGYFTAPGTWMAKDISAAIVQQWIDLVVPDYGIMLTKMDTASGEYVSVANRTTEFAPYLVINYTPKPVFIVGKINAQDYSMSLTDIGLTITSVKEDLSQRVDHIFPDAEGNFKVADVAPGTYSVGIKSSGFLQKIVGNVVVTALTDGDAGTVDLTNGDLDGDNEITSTDLSILGLGLGIAGDSF